MSYIAANLPFDPDAYADEVETFLGMIPPAASPHARSQLTRKKLTSDQRAELRQRIRAGENGAALARAYGITPQAVSYFRRRLERP